MDWNVRKAKEEENGADKTTSHVSGMWLQDIGPLIFICYCSLFFPMFSFFMRHFVVCFATQQTIILNYFNSSSLTIFLIISYPKLNPFNLIHLMKKLAHPLAIIATQPLFSFCPKKTTKIQRIRSCLATVCRHSKTLQQKQSFFHVLIEFINLSCPHNIYVSVSCSFLRLRIPISPCMLTCFVLH